MGKLGNGYGSEFHLLRWMGRHRDEFDAKVTNAIGKTDGHIRWLDFQFTRDGKDSEWKGIDFLPEKSALKREWELFWPNKSGIHNWDAIGILESMNRTEWILVEAKAHANEMQSNCQATDRESSRKIQQALDGTKQALGVDPERDWTKQCYQFTNRLAVLWFLHNQNIRAHLLHIYFTGDKRPIRSNPDWNPICPVDMAAWKKILGKQADLVGLPKSHVLSKRTHQLFLPAFSDGSIED